MNEDPKRLFEAEDAGAPLGQDLRRARGQDAGYDAVAGLARFEAAIATPLSAPPADAAGVATGGSKVVWVVAAVASATTAGAVAWALATGGTERNDTAPRAQAPAATATATAAEPAPAAPAGPPNEELDLVAEPPVAPVAVPPSADPQPHATDDPAANAPKTSGQPAPGKRGRSVGRPRSPHRGRPPDPDRLAAEMRATKQAKLALRDSPAQALELVRAAQKNFGEGVFGEERRGIKVLALFGVGRTAAAKKGAASYLKRHPKGTYADRIRAALAD